MSFECAHAPCSDGSFSHIKQQSLTCPLSFRKNVFFSISFVWWTINSLHSNWNMSADGKWQTYLRCCYLIKMELWSFKCLSESPPFLSFLHHELSPALSVLSFPHYISPFIQSFYSCLRHWQCLNAKSF